MRCLDEAKLEKLNYIYVNTHPQSLLPRRHICYTGLFQEWNNPSPKFFDLES